MTRPGFSGRFAHIRLHRDASDIEAQNKRLEEHRKKFPHKPVTPEQLAANKARSSEYLAKLKADKETMARLKALKNKSK